MWAEGPGGGRHQPKTPPGLAQGSPARLPRRDSIRSKDARPEPPGGVQVKPISVNSPTQLSAQITRAPNVPFRHLFPSPTYPFPLRKNEKSLDRASSPPSTGRDGLSDSELEPPPRPPSALGQPPDGNARWRPASRQESGSAYTSVFPVPETRIHSPRQGFDLPTLP